MTTETLDTPVRTDDFPPELAGYLAEFDDVNTVMSAAEVVRDAGYTRWDVHSPFPIHGMDEAMGIRPTILPWLVLAGGLAGLSGALLTFGSFQVAPNLLYQRPIVGPTPAIPDQFDPATGMYYAGVAPRNALADPFVVLDNRETFGGELLFVWDPTPAT